MNYVLEAQKQRRRDEKNRIALEYMAVMWNRIEPKDLPTLKSLIGDEDEDEDEDETPIKVPKKEQSSAEMADILKTLSMRSKRNKHTSRRG
jgi:hypothetical protein